MSSIESSNNHPEKYQDNESMSKLSRREFLKRVGGAAATSFFSLTALFAETKKAWSKEVKDGDSWLEGIEALRDDSLNSDEESLALYIKEKTKSGAWKAYTGGQTPVLLSVDVFNQEIAKNPEKISVAHCHTLPPFKEFGLSSEQIELIRKGDAIMPSMPPSTRDIFATIVTQAMGKKSGVHISSLAVDPRGVWEFDADINHEFAKIVLLRDKWLKFLQRYPNILFRLQNNLPISDITSKKQQEFIQEFEDAITLYKTNYETTYNEMHEQSSIYIQQSITQENLDISVLAEKYEALGITVTFKTFDELQKEEMLN